MRVKHRCTHCKHAQICRQHRRYKLVHRDSLKPCMWLNEHIHTAYRPPKLPWDMCVESIFSWNNETINIWSHFIGFIYFTYMQIRNNFFILPAIGASSTDHLVFTLSVFGSQACMGLSAGYHTFGCIDSKTRRTWLRADIFGISAGLLGMYLGGIYTSFYCFPEIQKSYLLVLTLILFITLYIPAQKNSLNKKFGNTRIGYLHLTYILITMFGLFPTTHWIALHGGMSHPYVMRWLPNILWLFALVGLAFIFYATLVPERFMPGTFDYIGCSHQWWHLLILAAMLFWHNAGIDLMAFYHTDVDSCYMRPDIPSSDELKQMNYTMYMTN